MSHLLSTLTREYPHPSTRNLTWQGIFAYYWSQRPASRGAFDMPIYEYHCVDCKRRVSLYYQTFSAADAATPACPNCGSARVSRLVSRVFQLKSEDAQLDDLADPSSFGDLDENDPKSVARWARKLGQQMGEDLGDDWGEMVDKLEAGEDMGDEGGPDGPGEMGLDDEVGAGPADF
jgi:putative FmdB family regulatory protein